MIFTNSILLTASESSGTGNGADWTQLIFLGVLMVGVILLMILPQRKRNKQMREMMDTLQPGSRIRTIGGIYGTVTQVKEDLVTIVSGPDEVKLVFAKGAIAVVEPAESGENLSEDELNDLEEKEVK